MLNLAKEHLKKCNGPRGRHWGPDNGGKINDSPPSWLARASDLHPPAPKCEIPLPTLTAQEG